MACLSLYTTQILPQIGIDSHFTLVSMSEPVHSEGCHLRFATVEVIPRDIVLRLEALHDGVAEAESVISTSRPVHRYLGREDSYKSAIVPLKLELFLTVSVPGGILGPDTQWLEQESTNDYHTSPYIESQKRILGISAVYVTKARLGSIPVPCVFSLYTGQTAINERRISNLREEKHLTKAVCATKPCGVCTPSTNDLANGLPTYKHTYYELRMCLADGSAPPCVALAFTK
ncbi:uncharacterized protein CIMG_13741 [Coccidioides immitis RS]|uniref:Uncharacterized protein n=1 Tax=Coccidioides immitis (strain RS) TaxID=246410 RepID=J3KC19_COCIM|nr:uncharacterized protein CIMG_13741 [Coccidioides immitis RS]EAS32733.3 hypothetical protein CIMG_13741 [Coccidioides immitis RS]